MKLVSIFIVALRVIACTAWSTPLSRKDVLSIGASATAAAFFRQDAALAFDGSGSSAYAGKKQIPREVLIEGYRTRIVADVADFVALGKAIDRGETDGDDWVAFFIEFQRREPDSVGRAYAARLDLVGEDGTGGAGLLLAGSFAKKGKPIEGLPQVKKFNALAKALSPLQSAGKSGDATKAKKAFDKAAVVLSEYLLEVGLPESLSDKLYQ